MTTTQTQPNLYPIDRVLRGLRTDKQRKQEIFNRTWNRFITHRHCAGYSYEARGCVSYDPAAPHRRCVVGALYSPKANQTLDGHNPGTVLDNNGQMMQLSRNFKDIKRARDFIRSLTIAHDSAAVQQAVDDTPFLPSFRKSLTIIARDHRLSIPS